MSAYLNALAEEGTKDDLLRELTKRVEENDSLKEKISCLEFDLVMARNTVFFLDERLEKREEEGKRGKEAWSMEVTGWKEIDEQAKDGSSKISGWYEEGLFYYSLAFFDRNRRVWIRSCTNEQCTPQFYMDLPKPPNPSDETGNNFNRGIESAADLAEEMGEEGRNIAEAIRALKVE